jgi:UDP-glucuronate decarboxylase
MAVLARCAMPCWRVVMLEPWVANALREDDRRIIITGAGGWLGLATLDLLGAALGDQLAKRVCAFGSTTRMLRLADGTPLLQRPLADMAWLPHAPSIVLHTAFLTKDRAEAMDEAQYRAANAVIRDTVLGALGPIGAQSVFVASSGAAAKADDPRPAMALYGAMKREDEAAFAQWAQDTDNRAVIARLYALAGPRINKPQNYAIASFCQDALSGRPIEVRAPREVIRAYVAIREVMSLAFSLLLDGQGVVRFDSGGTPLELAQVAALISPSVARAPITQGPPDTYHGDGPAYAALLRENGITPVPLAQALRETLEDMAGRPA